MLVAEGLTVQVRGRTLLSNVDLSVAPDEIVAIVGENGAGKSTLLKRLAGERPPPGAPVAVLLADGRVFVRMHVPEPLKAAYTAGTRVRLRADGVPGTFDGTVRYVSEQASFTPYYSLTQKDRSRLAFLAEVTVDDPKAAALPSGLPVQVTLATDAPAAR